MKKTRFILILMTMILLPALACGSVNLGSPDTTAQPVVETVVTVVVTTQVANPVEEPVEAPAAEPTAVPNESFEPLSNEEAILVELYQRVNPSVVNITVYAEAEADTLAPYSQGSGFVFDASGHVVTNAHVVHGATRVEVNFYDGRTRPAELVGEDLYSDLAVVQVAELPEGINPLPLGNMDELAVGQTAIAIGNPFGFTGTLTTGIISALGRTIAGLTIFSIPQTIQTDAAINPGNSGGPLLNLAGEVIGVNAQIRTGDESRSNSGVGFAIPVSIIERVIPELIANGKYDWTWLGVTGGSVSYGLAQAMDLPDDRGAYISEVVEGGPADRAGLQGSTGVETVDGISFEVGGDVIVAINGQPVSSFDDLLVYVALQTRPGDEVTLTVLRDGETIEVPLTLDARPADFQQ